ncbi:MAG: hypothetical protein ACJ8MR_08005, partial [Povalibacter sp.]
GILRTDSVRMRIDPAFRIETQIQADPLYLAIARVSPSDGEKLHALLQTQMAAGATVAEASMTMEPYLWDEVRRRTGWVDQATRLEWASFITDMLKNARKRNDPELCFVLMTKQTLDAATLMEKFSPEDHQRLRDLAIRIYESSDLGMRHELNSGDKPMDFNAAAREYAVIADEIEQRFGQDVARFLRSDTIQKTPSSMMGQVCAARIYQLDEMQRRPKAMASALVDSVLR